MDGYLTRTEMLLGKEALDKLASAKVAIFGVGGVGGYVAEALARSGVGSLLLVDSDRVDLTNINRQIIALRSTVGRYKTEVMQDRIRDINPLCNVEIRNCFFLPENASEFVFSDYTYVADCVDTVAAKIEIVCKAKAEGTRVISAMGAGNKIHPEMFEVADIYKTSVCPLAKVMRRELRKRGVEGLKVVYSKEEPAKTGSRTPGSIAFAPSVAGLVMAGEIVRDITDL